MNRTALHFGPDPCDEDDREFDRRRENAEEDFEDEDDEEFENRLRK